MQEQTEIPLTKGAPTLIPVQNLDDGAIILLDIANWLKTNYPDYVIKLLLVGCRPEDVAELKPAPDVEVYAYTFDSKPELQYHGPVSIIDAAVNESFKDRDVIVLLNGFVEMAHAIAYEPELLKQFLKRVNVYPYVGARCSFSFVMSTLPPKRPEFLAELAAFVSAEQSPSPSATVDLSA